MRYETFTLKITLAITRPTNFTSELGIYNVFASKCSLPGKTKRHIHSCIIKCKDVIVRLSYSNNDISALDNTTFITLSKKL